MKVVYGLFKPNYEWKVIFKDEFHHEWWIRLHIWWYEIITYHKLSNSYWITQNYDIKS